MPLAPYHMSVKTIGRSQGRSATAACAYRSGERIEDQRTGQVFDYSRRGGVERPQCAIFAPVDAPAWVQDRPALWNAVEAAEMRKNSTVAREFEIALPADLDSAGRQALVAQFATALVERHGMAVDASIHGPDPEAAHGQGNRNHHAHVLCSTRRIEPDGFGAKVRELDDQRSGEVEHWRTGFAAMCGDALEQAGHPEQAARWRAGHMHKAGQIEAARERGDVAFVAENENRVPGWHYGPNVIQIERKGLTTDQGDKVRAREGLNAEVIDLAQARERLAAERVMPAPAEPERRYGLLDAAREMRRADVEQGRDRRLLDVPAAAPVVRPREIVLGEWKAETDRQFQGLQGKAERVDGYARNLLSAHERRQEAHRRQRPQAPAGLFAAVKRTTYEAAAKAWEQTRAAIQKRIERLSGQIDKLAGYMRRAFPWEAEPSAGERLAERKAGLAQPALAAEYERVKQEAGPMVDIVNPGESEARRRAAALIGHERAEREGKLAAKLDAGIEAPSASPTLDGRAMADRMAGKAGADGKPLQTEQEKRVAEAREKIRASRDKEREDRSHGKDRGRGR